MVKTFLSAVCLIAWCMLTPLEADAAWRHGTPHNYLQILARLHPGDTLLLQPGHYAEGLPLHGLTGTVGMPIIISGPSNGPRPVFVARAGHNTVSIVDSAYVTLRNLELDGRGELADAIKAERHSSWAHHIVLENLYIHHHDADQQIVGISTKCPAWGWEIRHNIIENTGTGMYLGDSDGSAPFIGGLIEHNLIIDTVGYNLQIKHQGPRPADLAAMPPSPQRTVIRHNVFSKLHNGASGHAARPNVLVGHFPVHGAGAGDEYIVYGNFFYQNPHEALFQGEGNVALYNNVFVNTHGTALVMQPHHDVPRNIWIFHNTVLAGNAGILVQGAVGNAVQSIFANAVFAEHPLNGGVQQDNLAAPLVAAADYLSNPFALAGQLDMTPKSASLAGHGMDPSVFRSYPDSNRDYAGKLRRQPVRGAYATGKSKAPLRLERKLHPSARKPPP